jgi:hypothetical protein
MNSTTPATPATTWHGWARRGSRGRWRSLSTAATSDEALALVRKATSSWQHVDVCVLADHRDPNTEVQPR